MKLHKNIQILLEKKQTVNPCSPTNIFDMDLEGLLKLGYKKLTATDEIQDGDILQMSNANLATKEILWAITETSKYFRKMVRRSEVGNLIMYRK